jgi:hypothetical protein
VASVAALHDKYAKHLAFVEFGAKFGRLVVYNVRLQILESLDTQRVRLVKKRIVH